MMQLAFVFHLIHLLIKDQNDFFLYTFVCFVFFFDKTRHVSVITFFFYSIIRKVAYSKSFARIVCIKMEFRPRKSQDAMRAMTRVEGEISGVMMKWPSRRQSRCIHLSPAYAFHWKVTPFSLYIRPSISLFIVDVEDWWEKSVSVLSIRPCRLLITRGGVDLPGVAVHTCVIRLVSLPIFFKIFF